MLLERKPEVAAVKYGEEYAGNAKFASKNFACIFGGCLSPRTTKAVEAKVEAEFVDGRLNGERLPGRSRNRDSLKTFKV